MNKNYIARLLTLGIIILSLTTTGCAQKKVAWGDLKTGLILKYNLPQNEIITYKVVSDTLQNLEVMGQSVNTTIKADISYGIKGTGVDDQSNLTAQIIINHLNLAINSMQGSMNPDTSSLNGKSFGVTFSPEGKELKTTGTENLPKISLGQSGDRDANELLADLLPVLPGTAIKTGESWTTPVDRNLHQGQITVAIKGEATSVLEGTETIQGMECVKIKTVTKSAVQGSGSQMGQELNLKGDTTATATWYFAYKKGLFIKMTSDEVSDIKINVGTMEIPQKTNAKTEVELVL